MSEFCVYAPASCLTHGAAERSVIPEPQTVSRTVLSRGQLQAATDSLKGLRRAFILMNTPVQSTEHGGQYTGQEIFRKKSPVNFCQ